MQTLVFFGSSDLSCVVLEVLISKLKTFDIIAVTTKDKPSGRGLVLTPNPVKVLAQKNNIQVYDSLGELRNKKSNFPPNPLALVASYGRIIPQDILDIFGNHIYNIHPSDLPLYRGPSPLQSQILDGIIDTKVVIIKVDDQMDHGPIVASISDQILPDDTWQTLGQRLFTIGANLFTDTLVPHMVSHQVVYHDQDHFKATYTQKISRQDGYVEYADLISKDQSRKWRAYYPWPGVWSIRPDGKRVKMVSIDPVKFRVEGEK